MVRAIKGTFRHLQPLTSLFDAKMYYYLGTLVECDPSIKSIIINIDSEDNEYLVEDLDESHLIIKDNVLGKLKAKLEERLKETVPVVENESDSDRDVR
ncbi:transcription factor TFIIH complex subunit Tfb5-domain-containing protein [Xylariaceae sp. FL0662B]|nr:transcription factor TFIIH complex subunit Tfb5-domain-containing protein [Xylariaceae sp. FL0662B]